MLQLSMVWSQELTTKPLFEGAKILDISQING